MAHPLPRGSIAALPTPLHDDGSADVDALNRLIRHVTDGGCKGILVLGSSGEVAALDLPARRDVIDVATESASTECAVIVGIASPSIAGAIDDLKALDRSPVAAALVAPPFYGNPSPAAVERFYRILAAESDLPILGYNIPAFTGTPLDVQTVTRLAADGVLAGVKDSNRDLEYLQQITRLEHPTERSWTTYVGTDSLLLPALMFGVTGGITLAASIAPTWTAAVVDAYSASDFSRATAQQAKLTSLILALRVGAFPAGAKAALHLLSLGGTALAAPASGLSDAEVAALGQHLFDLSVPGFEYVNAAA